ncbi:1-phosphofructokinase family hexose kinase [Mycoplasmopsis alligatoris]|uniref:Hexose kinase, 1-phosphofructokinase family n=1 Tax=Mycoplasmopsis alligatoris A21JP2 TaxID=747682 RepID=D4XV94_9BACT|nr:1-phosphofructokinase family hexose kinase [Mycoplasmopsis alligatoris]EFF41739.1 hexose kinase, 1-phosphofructokinase family [Mycoplasmopsis alligatoris A21JP2]
MIYTITLSPTIDYSLKSEYELKTDFINRSTKEAYEVGGKGINVSIMLNNLATENVALGFVGGFTGNEIVNILKHKNIVTDFVNIQGNSRTNVKINIKNQKELIINATGPLISDKNLNDLYTKIQYLVKDGDVVVIAGNIPSIMKQDIYVQILELIKQKKVLLIVDATKDLLISTLKYKPFLIKPNLEEINEIFKSEIKNPITQMEQVKLKALELQKLGAQNVVISFGGQGSLLLDKNQEFSYREAIKGKFVSSTGAGDSMVAGFISKYLQTKNVKKSFIFGNYCGSATVFTTGIASSKEIDELIKKEGEVWE